MLKLIQTVLCLALTSAPFASSRADPITVVVISTNLGKMTVALDANRAPITVANFLAYVDEEAYDGTIFHRVIDDFMIQGGGYRVDLSETPEKGPITNEAENGLSNAVGTIAMARSNLIDSATRQFFINLVDNSRLDHKPNSCTRENEQRALELAERGLVKPNRCASYGYAVFGSVQNGLDVVERIAKLKTKQQGEFFDVPTEPVIILSIRREG